MFVRKQSFPDLVDSVRQPSTVNFICKTFRHPLMISFRIILLRLVFRTVAICNDFLYFCRKFLDMKKIIFILSIILLPYVVLSQEHMKFMGYEIDGSSYSFGQNLSERGFKKIVGTENGYEGTFSGYSCNVYFFCTPKTKLVYKVGVALDNIKEENVYLLIDQLISKYGKRNATTGSLTNVNTEKDGVFIETDNGEIQVRFNEFDESNKILYGIDGVWNIVYFDKINTEKNMDENYSDL